MNRIFFIVLLLGCLVSAKLCAVTKPSTPANKNKNCIDIRYYNAKGDNTTDNFNALQAAFDAASIANCDVYIPNDGMYWASCTTPLRLHTGLFGKGANSRLRITSPTGGTRDGLVVVENNIWIRDIAIVDTDAPGIYASQVADLLIERVTIDDLTPNSYIAASKNIGIYLEECRNITIRDCNITDTGYDGIYVGGTTHATISGNTVTGFHRLGIVVEGVGTIKSSGDIKITDNNISDANNSDDYPGEHNGGIWVENTNGTVAIKGNTISNIVGINSTIREPHGITIGTGITEHSRYEISSNTVDVGSMTRGVGCVIRNDYPSEVYVHDNILNNAHTGLHISAGSPEGPVDVVAKGNRFANYFLHTSVQGLIVTDVKKTAPLNKLIIEDLSFGPTVTGGTAILNFHDLNQNQLFLKNVNGDVFFANFPVYTATGPVCLYELYANNCYFWSSNNLNFVAHKSFFSNCKIRGSQFVPSSNSQGGMAKISSCEFMPATKIYNSASDTRFVNCIFDQAPIFYNNPTGGPQYLEISSSKFFASTSSFCIQAPMYCKDTKNRMSISNCIFSGTPHAPNVYMTSNVATYPSGRYYIYRNKYASGTTLEDLPATGTVAVDNQTY